MTRRTVMAVVGLAGIGIYSWIMMGTSGSAASWAWVILAASVAALAMAARIHRRESSTG